MLKINFDELNLQKCLCPNCPVQSENSCVKEQRKAIEENTKTESITSRLLGKHEEVPQLYCSKGKSQCADLKTDKECQCPKCDVWKENDLEVREAPAYFCINGKALDCCKITQDIDEAKLRELRRTYYTPI